MKTINFSVKGMHCNSCEIIVKEGLEETDGVRKAEVSWKNGTVKIEFDEKLVKEDKLKKVITSEGYEIK
jgi:copper chaperone CopZ